MLVPVVLVYTFPSISLPGKRIIKRLWDTGGRGGGGFTHFNAIIFLSIISQIAFFHIWYLIMCTAPIFFALARWQYMMKVLKIEMQCRDYCRTILCKAAQHRAMSFLFNWQLKLIYFLYILNIIAMTISSDLMSGNRTWEMCGTVVLKGTHEWRNVLISAGILQNHISEDGNKDKCNRSKEGKVHSMWVVRSAP